MAFIYKPTDISVAPAYMTCGHHRSRQEFKSLLRKPKAVRALNKLGVDPQNALDNGNSSTTINEHHGEMLEICWNKTSTDMNE